MTTRLTLLCHAPTAATRDARFPEDESLEEASFAVLRRVAAGPALRGAVARASRRFVAPERRALETAAVFEAGFVEDRGLRDADAGRWRGCGIDQLGLEEPDALSTWMSDAGAAPPGGEGVAAVADRMERWMTLQAGQGGRVAAVTHPALVRAAVVVALGAPAAAFWHVEAGPLAVASLGHDGRRWMLRGLMQPPRS